jgi:hypothetical protein
MRTSRRLRAAAGFAVAGIACAVYAWSVIGAFAHPSASSGAFSAAYQYSSGRVTGSGSIANNVSFSIDAKADANGVSGSCTVNERNLHRVNCITVTSLAVVGTHGTLGGTATHNGVRTAFTIDVDDLGEPAVGRDRFAITLGDGYSRSGRLTSGNLQVRAP